MMIVIRTWAALAITLAVVPGVAFGQKTTPEAARTIQITGRVVDVTGLPLPRATVIVAVVGSEKSATAVLTDKNGMFVLTSISSQRHELRFEEPGFMSSTIRLAQEATDHDINIGVVVMSIGEVTEGPMFPVKAPGKRAVKP